LQVKISKTKAINYNRGTTQELEELKIKHKEILEEKGKLERNINEINQRRDEEELKKIKVIII
jgi:hypothetical protein